MSVFHLDRIFRPRSVAVVGASAKPGSVGHTVLRNVLDGGFPGPVWPVNPKHATLLDRPCYATPRDLPAVADLAIVCTPAATVPDVVRACGEAGIFGLVVISAGFRETGPDGAALEQRVRDEARRFAGLRLIGPNCLGIIAPWAKLNASFAAAMPKAGSVAFLSQSGALCTAALDRAIGEGLGFSAFVSVGNMIDVDLGDLIDYFGGDPATRSLVLYAESIADGRKFVSASRAFSAAKPIVAYKAGRFAAAAKAAASHTGAMAGEDAVIDAAFRRAGIERLFQIGDVFDCAEYLARRRQPRGDRLAIVTNAGGPGVMAVDALLSRRGTLAEMSPTTIERLGERLPRFWSHGNPVDILGDAPPERYRAALEIVLADDACDAVLVVLAPQAMTAATDAAEAVVAAAETSTKPVLAAWMGGPSVAAGVDRLNAAGVPTFPTPEEAVETFMHLVSYARNLRTLYETPRDLGWAAAVDRGRIEAVVGAARAQAARAGGMGAEMKTPAAPQAVVGRVLLTEGDSKELLAAAGVPVTTTRVAPSAEDAVAVADELGYPVVLKVLSPQITHKTDIGGVVLDLATPAQVRDAFASIESAVRTKRPDARFDGVTVQPQVDRKDAVELILGAKRDPVFGMVLMAGLGGTAAEVWLDRVLELPPLTERLARRMLESLRGWPLLRGHRGRPAVDIDQVIATLMRLSDLIVACPEIIELDINPLLAGPRQVVALDARVVIDAASVEGSSSDGGATGCVDAASPKSVVAYPHLSIRPYPHEYMRHVTLTDGTSVRLRPIRPEDEPRWVDLLRACSPITIRSRFRAMISSPTHEMATRYCFLDYDRELALVAEVDDGGPGNGDVHNGDTIHGATSRHADSNHGADRPLMGVGRLVSDPDRRTAEFAVLVADPWQGRGLGLLLTQACVDVATTWGVETLTAETDAANVRMVSAFRESGWTLRDADEPGRVVAERKLERTPPTGS